MERAGVSQERHLISRQESAGAVMKCWQLPVRLESTAISVKENKKELAVDAGTVVLWLPGHHTTTLIIRCKRTQAA